MQYKNRHQKSQWIRSLLIVSSIAVTFGVLPMSRAADKPADYVLVVQEKDVAQVTAGMTGKTLFKSHDSVKAIEWAMNHSPITVVTEGTYTLSANISIPRPNVSLVIAENAELVTAKDAKVINVTEKHGNYYPLIHNAGHDNVNIINFGILNPSAHHPHDGQVNNVCIIYDGRNSGTNGIEGGMIFSCGKLLTDGDAVWIVDSKDVRVPLIWCRSTGNTLAIEGSDDISIGTVAELNIEGRPTGKGRHGNEAIDLNSFCRRIHCELAIGTAAMEETVDINNSPDCTFEDVRAYGRGRTFSENVYPPTGKRLTQKAYIDNSDGTIVKNEENDRSKIIKSWETEFEVQGLLKNLPLITVKARLTAVFENSPKEELLNKTYNLDLSQPLKSALPNVLIIGDSISMGYTPPLVEILEGKANVVHNPGNAKHSRRGLARLDEWLGETKWDVIHFNHGIHDLKYVDNDKPSLNAKSLETGHPQIPLDEYRKNMEAIVVRLKKTGAKLIFATTTPFAEDDPANLWFPEQHTEKYNMAAMEIMTKHKVVVNDLHAFVMPQLDKLQRPSNCHFTDHGSKVLAQQVAKHVLKAIDRKCHCPRCKSALTAELPILDVDPFPATGSNVPASIKKLKWKLPAGTGKMKCDVIFGSDADMKKNDLIIDKQAVESVFVTLADSKTYYWKLALYDDSKSKTKPCAYSPVYTFKAFDRHMEKLDRGITAMNIGEGNVFIGWRMLKTDPSDIAFNIYRNLEKLNSFPIIGSTNYLDTSADLAKTNTYSIVPVINSDEQTPSVFVLAADTPVAHAGSDTDPAVHSSFPFSAAVGRSDSISHVGIGDLDGDGKYDYVIKHPMSRYDPGRNPAAGSRIGEPVKYEDVKDETFKIAAYNNDGTFMWEVDLGHNIVLGLWWSPMVVYDLDMDGKAEVITKTAPKDVDYRQENGHVQEGPEWFTVFDGETGAELATDNWIARGGKSDWGDSSSNRVNRNYLAVAYLDGIRPSLIVFRGTYKKMAAQAWNFHQDNSLEFLWEWNRADDAGGGFHSAHIGDIDGDGKDEILNGVTAIDDDGTTLWVANGQSNQKHGDRFTLTDIDPSRDGLEVFYTHEGTKNTHPIHINDADTGTAIWAVGTSGTDIGRGVCYDVDPRYPGMESWTEHDLYGMLDVNGNRIADQPIASGYALWWGPDLFRESFHTSYAPLLEYDYLTAKSKTVADFGAKSIDKAWVDVIGDWREEVLIHDDGMFKVCTPRTITGHRFYTFMHDPIYRNDIATQSSGYKQHGSTSFYIGSDMRAPAPDPMIWSSAPAALAGDTSITMTAATAAAYGHGGVEYYFDCLTEGGHDSGWQNSQTYTDTGLKPGRIYTYRVKTRGLSHLETAYSNAGQARLNVKRNSKK